MTELFGALISSVPVSKACKFASKKPMGEQCGKWVASSLLVPLALISLHRYHFEEFEEHGLGFVSQCLRGDKLVVCV